MTAISLFCLCSGGANAQVADGGESLPSSPVVGLADNGDLLSWKFNGQDNGNYELVDPGARLMVLQLLVAEKDVSNQISWRRLKPDPGEFGAFVGTHADLGLEIHRSYLPGQNPQTIIHEIRVTHQRKWGVNDFQMFLKIPLNLSKHAPHDGSLGEVFYDYSRVFATASATDAFEPVRENSQATAAALATRHIAMVVTPQLLGNEWLMVRPESGTTLTLKNAQDYSHHRQVLEVVELRGLVIGHGRYRSFLYADTLVPLRGLARLIERALEVLSAGVGNSGVAIIVFALLLRVVLLPLGLWSIRQQRQFTSIQQNMKPQIEHINNTLKGAQKSEQILQTYKDYGISPFSGLKGSVGLFVQLPILIVLFAVTTESALFRDAQFLWASDLSLPDRAFALPFSIPGLGGYVNLLPLFLGVVSVLAALIQVRTADPRNASSPRPGLLLALVFVVFFYSCAAALVLYWIVVNIFQIIEGLYVTRTTPTSDKHQS